MEMVIVKIDWHIKTAWYDMHSSKSTVNPRKGGVTIDWCIKTAWYDMHSSKSTVNPRKGGVRKEWCNKTARYEMHRRVRRTILNADCMSRF